MVVASGSIAGKIFDYQVISLQGCRLDFRVGSTCSVSDTRNFRPLLGVLSPWPAAREVVSS